MGSLRSFLSVILVSFFMCLAGTPENLLISPVCSSFFGI